MSHSSSSAFKTAIPSLFQRHFDSNHNVRLAVTCLAANLLLDWPDRRENLVYLVPLVLTGLEDESPENVDKARESWTLAGNKWIEEEAKRDKRLKDLCDFPIDEPKHYPSNGNLHYLGLLLQFLQKVL